MNIDEINNYWWCTLIWLLIALRAGVSLWSDLVFYKKNSWNFELDSGEKAFYGQIPLAANKIPNRERVLFCTPTFLLIAILGAAFCGLKMFGF